MTIPKVGVGLEYAVFIEQLAYKIRNDQVIMAEDHLEHTCYFCGSKIEDKPVKLIVIEDPDHPKRTLEDKFAIHNNCYDAVLRGEWEYVDFGSQ